MPRHLICSLLGVSLYAAAQTAFAADATMRIPAGDTEIHLTQRAERVLPRDRIHVDLRAEAKGSDPRQVQGEVNERMTAALALVKRNAAVTGQSGNYMVFRDYDPKAAGLWHANQTLSLSGKDFAIVLDLAGQLQGSGLVISGMRFDLAPATARAIEDDLTADALKALRERADKVASDLGMTLDRFVSIAIGDVDEDGGRRPMPMMRAMAAPAMAAVPPPVAEAGDATVSLTVDAVVALAPRH